jgi:hypothetical protein
MQALQIWVIIRSQALYSIGMTGRIGGFFSRFGNLTSTLDHQSGAK